MQNQLMKIEGSKKANRKSRSAKAMAVLSGGVLAVIAAVRVTTASEMATTQAAATQASTTQEANASTMPTTVPSLAFAATQDSATTAPSLAMGDMPATQPSDALSINDSPSDELLKRFHAERCVGLRLARPCHQCAIQSAEFKWPRAAADRN